MPRIIQRLQNVVDDIRLRYACLEETWQRGYTLDYRLYRFREAVFPLLGDPSDE